MFVLFHHDSPVFGLWVLHSGSSVSCQSLALALMFPLSPDLPSSPHLGAPTLIVVQNYVLGGFLVMFVKVRDRRTRGRWQGIPSLALIPLLEAGLFPGCSLRYKTFFLSPETLAVVLSLPRQFACLVSSKCYCVISVMYLLPWILTVRSQYFIMVRMY